MMRRKKQALSDLVETIRRYAEQKAMRPQPTPHAAGWLPTTRGRSGKLVNLWQYAQAQWPHIREQEGMGGPICANGRACRGPCFLWAASVIYPNETDGNKAWRRALNDELRDHWFADPELQELSDAERLAKQDWREDIAYELVSYTERHRSVYLTLGGDIWVRWYFDNNEASKTTEAKWQRFGRWLVGEFGNKGTIRALREIAQGYKSSGVIELEGEFLQWRAREADVQQGVRRNIERGERDFLQWLSRLRLPGWSAPYPELAAIAKRLFHLLANIPKEPRGAPTVEESLNNDPNRLADAELWVHLKDHGLRPEEASTNYGKKLVEMGYRPGKKVPYKVIAQVWGIDDAETVSKRCKVLRAADASQQQNALKTPTRKSRRPRSKRRDSVT